MSSPTFAVFGAGRQGTAAIHDFVTFANAETVLVVEPDADRRTAATKRLKRLLGRNATKVRYVESATAGDLRGLGAALSCAPYRANLALTRLCLDAEVPFCDLGGNPATVAKQEELAAGAKTPVVPECGISPGLSNIIAVHYAETYRATAITVRCGGIPLTPPDPEENPLAYKLVFSPEGLVSEYSGQVPVIRDGKLTTIEALSVVVPYGPGLECSPTSNNAPQVVAHLAKLGVEEYDYMTVRYQGHWGRVLGWKTLGYLCGDPQRDAQLVAWLNANPVLQYDARKDRDRLILAVLGGRRAHGIGRAWEYRLDVEADPETGFTAMELTTSWGGTIVATHMATGRGMPKGFATPERFVDHTWVMAEVERRLMLRS